MLNLLSLLQLPPSCFPSGVSGNWDWATVEKLCWDNLITEGIICISWTSVSDFSCSMKIRMEAARAVERLKVETNQMNRIGSTIPVGGRGSRLGLFSTCILIQMRCSWKSTFSFSYPSSIMSWKWYSGNLMLPESPVIKRGTVIGASTTPKGKFRSKLKRSEESGYIVIVIALWLVFTVCTEGVALYIFCREE